MIMALGQRAVCGYERGGAGLDLVHSYLVSRYVNSFACFFVCIGSSGQKVHSMFRSFCQGVIISHGPP